MEPRDSLGSRIGRLRKEKHLTIADLAEQLGVSRPTVWAWEKDKVTPRDKRIPRLAEALEVAESELVLKEPVFDDANSGRALEREVADSKARIAAILGIGVDGVEIRIKL